MNDQQHGLGSVETTLRGGGQLAGLDVLVVGDDEDARELISTILANEGALVTAAGSIEEALDRLERAPFGLIVFEFAMSKGRGAGVVARVRDKMGVPRHGPAIALTTSSRVEDRMLALQTGFASHVSKPVVASELIAVAMAVAGRR